jgi:hypothetical protein
MKTQLMRTVKNVMTRLRDARRRRKLKKILDEIDEQYAGVFRKLAE